MIAEQQRVKFERRMEKEGGGQRETSVERAATGRTAIEPGSEQAFAPAYSVLVHRMKQGAVLTG